MWLFIKAYLNIPQIGDWSDLGDQDPRCQKVSQVDIKADFFSPCQQFLSLFLLLSLPLAASTAISAVLKVQPVTPVLQSR